MTEGSFQTTNNPLDVAIEGAGFLRVGAGEPKAEELTAGLPAKLQYTRAGDLTTDASGYLTTQSGEYVIGRNAEVAAEAETGNTYKAGEKDTLHQDPARLRQHVQSARTAQSATPTRKPAPNSSKSGSPPAISRSRRSPTNLGSNAWVARCGGRPPTPARRSSAPPTPPASVPPSAASSRCRTSTWQPR